MKPNTEIHIHVAKFAILATGEIFFELKTPHTHDGICLLREGEYRGARGLFCGVCSKGLIKLNYNQKKSTEERYFDGFCRIVASKAITEKDMKMFGKLLEGIRG